MSITKLKWQWQGTAYSNTQNIQPPNPHTGRVITGMLTGGDFHHQSPKRSGGGSNGNNNGFGF